MRFNLSLTKTAITATVATISLSFFGSNAQAALLIGNIDNGTVANQGNQVNGSDNEFVSFTTPDDGITRIVDDITVQLSNSFGTASFDATLIWFDDSLPASGDPTGVTSTIAIGTQSVSVTAGQPTNAIFTPGTDLILQPNTRYGFRLNGTPGSGLTWLSQFTVAGDFDSTYESDVNATFLRAYRTNDGGTVWSVQTSQRIFEINVSTVPEPGTILGIVGIGLLGLSSTLKNKNKD